MDVFDPSFLLPSDDAAVAIVFEGPVAVELLFWCGGADLDVFDAGFFLSFDDSAVAIVFEGADAVDLLLPGSLEGTFFSLNTGCPGNPKDNQKSPIATWSLTFPVRM